MVLNMKLREWLKENKMTLDDFAKKIGVTHVHVSRWQNGRYFPHNKNFRKIHKATGGQVCPNDFYGVGPTIAKKR